MKKVIVVLQVYTFLNNINFLSFSVILHTIFSETAGDNIF